eukprot:GFYU01009202.1.p1 GENE.GFYU01009202.1~~GFYU01009202.1.p1  ORF type:complete len:270 (+),score=54.63 GFYU01009202.1:217-1026(+)
MSSNEMSSPHDTVVQASDAGTHGVDAFVATGDRPGWFAEAMTLLGKHVTVHLQDGHDPIAGYLYTIDPQTSNVIVVATKDVHPQEATQGSVSLIMSHGVSSVTETPATECDLGSSNTSTWTHIDFESTFPGHSRKGTASMTDKPSDTAPEAGSGDNVPSDTSLVDMAVRDQVVAKLKKFHMPVDIQADGVLCVAGSLYIYPPYDDDSYRSTNPIVMQRITEILHRDVGEGAERGKATTGATDDTTDDKSPTVLAQNSNDAGPALTENET